MWSIRVLKDEAVPVGHSASCTHPRAHLVLRKLQQNAAINKSPSGFCLEDPIVTAPTTAACVPCKSTERLCYSFQFEVCAAWVSFFAWISVFMRLMWHDIEIFLTFFFASWFFTDILFKKNPDQTKIFRIGAQLHICTCVQLAFSLSLSHCCVLTVSCRFESRYCWVTCFLCLLMCFSLLAERT